MKNSNVIPALNAPSIYEVPSLYSKAGLDKVLLKELGYDEKKYPLDLSAWNNVVKKIHNTSNKVLLALLANIH